MAVRPFLLAGSSRRPHTKAERKTPPGGQDLTTVQAGSPKHSGTESFDLGGDEVPPPEDPDRMIEAGQQDDQPPPTVSATVSAAVPTPISKPPSSADATSDTQSTGGATAVKVITASTSKPRLPMPELMEDGHVLPPCTVKSFPAPHPTWKIQRGERERSDILPKSLPIVPGVLGN